MAKRENSVVTELTVDELDLVAAAGAYLSLNLSNLVNLNIAVPTQVGNNIAVLTSNITQTLFQGIGFGQRV